MERLAIESQRRRRLGKLKRTVATNLKLGHIDSLEFLEIAKGNRPQIIYDIGANIGTWTILAKACLPDSIIHAFEPLLMHHEPFVNMLHDVPDVTLHKVALGSRSEVLNMNVTSFSDASSLLEITEATVEHFGVTRDRKEKVTVFSLDEYVATTQLPLPDIIKLDIQGYELEAMRGAEKCLAYARFVICEVSFIEFYKGQALFYDIVEFMAHHNFHLEAFGVNTPLGKKLLQTDAMFARSGSH